MQYLLAALGAVEIGLWLASIASRLFGRGAKRAVIALTPVVGARLRDRLGMSLRILPGGHMVTVQRASGPVSAYMVGPHQYEIGVRRRLGEVELPRLRRQARIRRVPRR